MTTKQPDRRAALLLAGLLVFTAGTSFAQGASEQGSMLNGQPLPSMPSRSASEERVLMAEQVDASGRPTGLKIFTFKTVRLQGTRSPIHMHGFGGQTCIVSGEMTLLLEGAEPQKARAGACYWMPPGRRMAGVNTGGENALMFDTFVAPSEQAIWTVVEPGLQDEQDQFSGMASVDHKH